MNATNRKDPALSQRDGRAAPRGLGSDLRVHDLWRRTPSIRDKDEKFSGPVRNASMNKVQSRRRVMASQHEPDVGHPPVGATLVVARVQLVDRRPRAGRACVNPADVERQSPRRRGYRASSGDNRAMGGGFIARLGRRPVRRSGNVGRGWFGKSTCPTSPKRGDEYNPHPLRKAQGDASKRSDARRGCPANSPTDTARVKTRT